MNRNFNRLCAFAVIFLTFSVSSITGQVINAKDTGMTNIFTARIKQFGEFAARFNYREDFKGNPPDSIFRIAMPREKMLATLFDNSDARINPKNKSYSPEYVKARADFIREITESGIELDRYSPGVIAEARSKVLYNGNPATISIFLNQEAENGGLKWVLIAVTGLFGEEFKEDSSMVRFIQPTSNETDFINLQRALGDKGYLHEYAYKDFKPDNLSVFLYCVNTGIIQYEYTEEVTYHIISIPGWYLKIKDFNRNELNSGWLVTDLIRGNYKPEDFRYFPGTRRH